MNDTSRRRGRPLGATRFAKIDRETLSKVADLVTDAKPPLTPTAAMRRLNIHDPSAHRRLQRKWKTSGSQLEQAVRERRRVASTRATVGGPPSAFGAPDWLRADLERQRQIRDIMDPPHMRAIRESMGEAQRLRDTIDPPALRAAREQLENVRRVRDMLDSPGVRLMQQQIEEAKRIRDIIDPPHLRALGLFR